MTEADKETAPPAVEHDEKSRDTTGIEEVENTGVSVGQRLSYHERVEPQFHHRTWIALVAFFLLNFVQVVAIQSPAAVLNYIGTDLGNTTAQSWIVLSLSVVQGVLGPLISSVSDLFQARKLLLVGSCTISFIGACIAPGSTDIYRLIGANVLIGVGFASVPLAYTVPSEILPRRWRPLAQAGVGVAALLGNTLGPLTIGILTKQNAHTGWRTFYWIQAAFWGATVLALVLGYNPPKRETELEHLSFWSKLGHIDLIGCGLLTAGLALFLTGTGLGGGLYAWTNASVLSAIIIGILMLISFGLYEWKGTKTGILHHDLFRAQTAQGRTFALCVGLLFIEAILIFSYGIFTPIMSEVLFTSDAVMVVVRSEACFVTALVSAPIWGFISSHFRTIRAPLIVGFIFFTGGLTGFATVQPDDSANTIAFSVLTGVGFGAVIVLAITGVHLSTPHKFIATATACSTSSRAIGGGVFGAINSAVFQARLRNQLPTDIAAAAAGAGLTTASIPGFVAALVGGEKDALAKIPGVTPAIIGAGVAALKQAYANSMRVIFIIAAPFGVVAIIACFFLGDIKGFMDYHVDAPVEDLHAKRESQLVSA